MAAHLPVGQLPRPTFRDPQRAVALAKYVLPPRAGHYWRDRPSPNIAAAIGRMRPNRSIKRWTSPGRRRLRLAPACHGPVAARSERGGTQNVRPAQEAIDINQPIFYEYLGIMAVDRLRHEAEMLLGDDK